MNQRGRSTEKAVLAVTLSLSVWSGTAAVSAEPGRWDRARDPSASAASATLRAGVRARSGRDLSDEAIPGAEPLLALRGATLMALAGLEGSEDPDVLFFLGDSWVTADRGEDARALAVLERALSRSPDSPVAPRAWFDVGVARARLGDFDGARTALSTALDALWDPAFRAQAFLLRAEVGLALGDFRGARKDAEAALARGTDTSLRALARFARAVSFARDDDLPDALPEAWEASRPSFVDSQGTAVTVLDLPGTRLLRPFDAFYYRALASMAEAERAELPATKKMELEWAVSQWKRYVADAKVAHDPGADSAARLLASTEKRLRNLCDPRIKRRGGALPRGARAGCD